MKGQNGIEAAEQVWLTNVVQAVQPLQQW